MTTLTKNMLEQSDAFERVGIPAFVQKHPEERNGDALIRDRQDENIDMPCPTCPVGQIETQQPLLPKGKPLQDGDGDLNPGQRTIFEQPLNPPIMGGELCVTAQGRGNLGNVDSSDANEGDKKL